MQAKKAARYRRLTARSFRAKKRKKSQYCKKRCPPATRTPQLNHLKIPLYSSKWETKLPVPFDQLSWFMSGTRHARRFLFEIPSMLDNQKHSPHLPPSPTALHQQHPREVCIKSTDGSNVKTLKNQKAFFYLCCIRLLICTSGALDSVRHLM